MEPRVFTVAVDIGISGLIGENACSTDLVVVRAVIVTVDPELGLVLFDQAA